MSRPLIVTAVAAVVLTAATFTASAAPARLLPAEAAQAAAPAKGQIVKADDRHRDRRHGWHHDRDHRRWDRLGPHQVSRIVSRHGYHRIEGIHDRGRYYVVSATGRHGRPVRLSVHAHTGQIIEVDHVRDRASSGSQRGHFWR